MEDRLLTITDAARIAQVLSAQTLKRAAVRGELDARKVGGRWFVHESELRRWLESITTHTNLSGSSDHAHD